ncbi:MAG: HxsD-like protein [Candidatus Omnitrophota bacterium]
MEKNSKTVVFNKDLYSLSAIQKAIEAFRGLAGFKVQTAKSSYKVIIKNLDQDIDGTLEDELSNYILAEMKNE